MKINKKDLKQNESEEFKSVKKYGLILLLALLILNTLAFFAFRAVAEMQMRYDLMTFSKTIKPPGNLSFNLSYSNGIVAIPKKLKTDDGDDYKEITVAGTEYLVYAPPGQNYLLAVPESQLRQDLILTGIILAVLYLCEVIFLLSWWTLLSEKIKSLFEIR